MGSYHDLCFGFPRAKNTMRYRWNFLYWHIFEESNRLYAAMGVSG